jgi:hypothetical protein
MQELEKKCDDDSVNLVDLLRKEGMDRAIARYGEFKNDPPTDYKYFAEGYKDGVLMTLNKME